HPLGGRPETKGDLRCHQALIGQQGHCPVELLHRRQHSLLRQLGGVVFHRQLGGVVFQQHPASGAAPQISGARDADGGFVSAVHLSSPSLVRCSSSGTLKVSIAATGINSTRPGRVSGFKICSHSPSKVHPEH